MIGVESGSVEGSNTWCMQLEVAPSEVTPVEVAKAGEEDRHPPGINRKRKFALRIGSLAAADAWRPASEGESAGGSPIESVAPVLA
jgi:hypothetical protein